MGRKLLKIASVINLVLGMIFSVLFLGTMLLGGFGIFGIIFFAGAIINFLRGGLFFQAGFSDKLNIKSRKTYGMIASILSLFTGHLISFILGMVAFSELEWDERDKNNSNLVVNNIVKKELTEEEKMKKRLRNLLALGCGLVLLSGIVFAMTTWETLSGFGKTIALVVASLIFFLMSKLAEDKFKLKNSGATYYILANSFLILTIVAAGYFDIFGKWFSFNGEGKYLYISVLWMFITALSYIAYLKYNFKWLLYTAVLPIFLSLIYILLFAKVTIEGILLVLISILTVCCIDFNKEGIAKVLKNISIFLLPIIYFAIFSNIVNMNLETNVVILGLNLLISSVSAYLMAINNKNIFYQILAPVYVLGTSCFLINNITINSNIIFTEIAIISVIVSLIGYYKKEEKCLFNTSLVIADFVLLLALIDTLNLGLNYFSVIFAIILLGISVAISISKKFGDYHFEKILEPIKVVILAYTIYRMLYNYIHREEALFLAIIGIVLAIVCIFKKNIIKNIYFYGSALASGIAVFINLKLFSPIVQSLTFASFLILLIISIKSHKKDFNNLKYGLYCFNLLAFAGLVLNVFRHFELELIGIIILAFTYAILFMIFNKNKIVRCCTVAFLLIPYTIILPISVFNDNVNSILYSLPWLALIFIYTRGFLYTWKTKNVNVIETVLISIWYISNMFNICLENAIFIGIISFGSILIGFKNNKWESLYYTGCVFLVLNTLVQLREFWTAIPIWAYILVAGLGLIGLVTYKEYRRMNRKEETEEEVKEEVIENTIQVENEIVEYDTLSTTTGTIMYFILIPILIEIITKAL